MAKKSHYLLAHAVALCLGDSWKLGARKESWETLVWSRTWLLLHYPEEACEWTGRLIRLLESRSFGRGSGLRTSPRDTAWWKRIPRPWRAPGLRRDAEEHGLLRLALLWWLAWLSSDLRHRWRAPGMAWHVSDGNVVQIHQSPFACVVFLACAFMDSWTNGGWRATIYIGPRQGACPPTWSLAARRTRM
ncbi:hypothetical protein BGZ63DRAFT_392376 [Mariannaea sp. PMI_226]|nr:hypothetical protein BGZ63DRAFT_392376 [Mariannaea sp. PMI_226]